MTLLAAGLWGSWRRGIAFAFVGISAWWVLLNETLSLFGALTRQWVALGYVAAAGILAIAVVRRPPPRPQLQPWTASPWCWAVGALAAVLAVLALVAAPNNFDSMAYHLPKVEQWIALGGIKNFPAEYLPQIYLAPLSESAIVDLHLLAGTDRYDNLVQWLAYLVSLVSVTVLAENTGATQRAQVYTLVVAATVPMAVAQAVTTQNDLLFTALLLVAAVAATERPLTSTSATTSIALCALAIGLAVAAKATAILFGVPILIWAIVRQWRSGYLIQRHTFVVLPVIAALLVLPNLGWTLRNLATFGHPLGNDEVPSLTLENPTPQGVLANTVRVATYNLGVPAPAALNDAVADTVSAVVSVLGVNPDDQGAVYSGPFNVDSERNEDRVSSTLSFILIAASLILVSLRRDLRRQHGGLAVVIASGTMLLAAALKWQPWGVRFTLPLLLLGSVTVGVMVARWRPWQTTAALTALMLACLPWAVASKWRPLIGPNSVLVNERFDGYYLAQPDLREPHAAAAAYVRSLGVDEVGIGPGMYYWEYPFLRTLNGSAQSIRPVHVDVENSSSKWASADRPAVVVCECRRPVTPGTSVTYFGPLQVEVAATLRQKNRDSVAPIVGNP